jgi:zinc transport system ATP-binding protein
MAKQAIIEIKNLTYKYEKLTVLENVSLTINKGEFLGIVGPNGSGKSTMLKLLLGLLSKQQGEIFLFGESIEQFKDWQKVGYVSQKANSFNTGFPATVFEVVASGLTKKLGLFRFFKQSDKPIVLKALASVGMDSFLHRNIGELSGGQQQRVFIARALVSEPELLILDEPTVGVDAENVKSFYEMLYKLNMDWNMTLLLVTHDIGTVTDKLSHVACLNKKLHFMGNTIQFLEHRKEGLDKLYNGNPILPTHHHDERGDIKC